MLYDFQVARGLQNLRRGENFSVDFGIGESHGAFCRQYRQGSSLFHKLIHTLIWAMELTRKLYGEDDHCEDYLIIRWRSRKSCRPFQMLQVNFSISKLGHEAGSSIRRHFYNSSTSDWYS